jgi:arginine decarboxylase
LRINAFIEDFISKGISRFFMPAHKGNISSKKIIKYDITEIDGADYLFSATGIIRNSEILTAKLFGVKNTIYSTSGSTLCIQTMLSVLKRELQIEKIIAIRNVHISFVNACALCDITPIWIYPNYTDENFVGGVIDIEKLENMIIENQDAGAVYITSPDYLGNMAVIKKIAEICKRHNKILCVDNAHGAYLKFTQKDLHPMSLGADICCDSVHKTLLSLTGGAFLHSNLNVDYLDLKKNMSIFGSTSPSYLTLASLDKCNDYLEKYAKKDFTNLEKKIKRVVDICRQRGISGIFNTGDFCKLTLDYSSIGYDSEEIRSYLQSKKIEPEYIGGSFVVFLISPFNKKKDFRRLENAIKLIEIKKAIKKETFDIQISNSSLNLRNAFLCEYETVDIDDAQGRFSAEVSIKCPPGVPIIIYGEEISQNLVKVLKNNGIFKIKVLK